MLAKVCASDDESRSGAHKKYFLGSAFLFAFALLCAGQSASITATLAGQVVSEGFLRWKLSVRDRLELFPTINLFLLTRERLFLQPFLRRLVTRLISMTVSRIRSNPPWNNERS